MRLGLIFLATLAISVILSSTATWGLTFSTSYTELLDMSDGFVQLTSLAVDDFARLVGQLIADSGTFVSGILDAEYNRSMTQLNETQTQFLDTTLDLMALAKNTTTQTQQLVAGLLVSFGSFVQSVILTFQTVGGDYASRLRVESASQTQASFNNMIQSRIYSLQRQARLYHWGLLNLSRRPESPQDDGSCTLLGVMCSFSMEVNSNVFVGSSSGGFAFCDVTDVAYSVMVVRGATADQVYLPVWPPFIDTAPHANLTAWKSSCMAPFTNFSMNVSCPHGTVMEYPNSCNNGCGYDPRCRPWYQVQLNTTTPATQMSAVYTDIHKGIPVMSLSYPIYAGSPPTLVGVAGTNFFFSEVDAFLTAIGSSVGASQLVSVVLNTTELLLVGASQPCPGNGSSPGGVPLAQACHVRLRELAGWLAANRLVQSNASLELSGTLWDVFPSTVDTFTYFVVVGMNRSEVYAVVDATNQAANHTLQLLQQEQSAKLDAYEAAALSEMEGVAAEKIAASQAQRLSSQKYMKMVRNETEQQFDAYRQKSSAVLDGLIASQMGAIATLKDRHLSQVVNNVGTTFGAMVGILAGILLCSAYGISIVTKQVQNITQTMEDVADMKVEALQVTAKSTVREVERIEAALCVLVQRLAEYKTYMPAALFQPQQEPQGKDPPPGEDPASPESPKVASGKNSPLEFAGRRSPSSSLRTRSPVSGPSANAHAPVGGSGARLLRRHVAALVVNLVRFQREMAQCSAGQLEGTLNHVVSVVHKIAFKAQGNIDAILGDQVLVTFNAHFGCSDPPVTASHVARDLLLAFKDFEPGLQLQIGLSAGSMYSGHLGYAQFKAMVALGAPMKVASLLAHLSDFDSHTVLVCPSVVERIKYHFTLQPVDLLALPQLGELIALYAKAVCVSSLLADSPAGHGSQEQEWLYEVKDRSSCQWSTTFHEAARAPSVQKAKDHVLHYLRDHPDDPLAHRLLARLPRWQPRAGLVVAERPDSPPEAGAAALLCGWTPPVAVENLA
eukprot:EG_transcript_1138